MERNPVMNHRPNTSTYNMIVLVYGSMQDYQKAKHIFQKMHEQWEKLNEDKDNYDVFDEIYAGASRATR